MRRLVGLLTVVVFFAGAIACNPAMLVATAQDATANHPLVGIWRTAVVNEGDTSFSSLSTFHADGTYTEVLPEGLVLTGLWTPSGARTDTVTAYLNYFLDNRLVEGVGRYEATVGETGNTLVETGNFVGLYEDGSVAIAVDSPATGVRLGVLPVEPLGTPVVPGASASSTPAS